MRLKGGTLESAFVRELIEQAGGLVGAAQMAERWGITRQGVHIAIKRNPDFPEPLPGLVGNSDAWLWNEVDAWWRGRHDAG